METIDLTGKIALITGASRGIGKQTAIRMANAGAHVAVNYHRSEAEALEVVQQIGDSAMAVGADVADAAQAEAMTNAVIKRFGRVEMLVNHDAPFGMDPLAG